jgi:hypothetical protein
MSSLIDWLGRMGITIFVQGPPPMNTMSEIVEGDRDRLIGLANRGIALKGEESDDPEPASLQVRVGQCWALEDKVLEITGFTSDRAEYLEWTPSQNIILPGVGLGVDPSDGHRKYQKGHGTDLSISLSELGNSRILVERSPNFISTEREIVPSATGLKIIEKESLSSTIVGVRNRIPATHRPLSILGPDDLSFLDGYQFESIYTDGSWSKENSLSSLLLGNGSIKSCCSHHPWYDFD